MIHSRSCRHRTCAGTEHYRKAKILWKFTDFEKLPQLVFENDLLLEDGVLIIEHSNRTSLAELPFYKNSRKYGGSVFSFFEK